MLLHHITDRLPRVSAGGWTLVLLSSISSFKMVVFLAATVAVHLGDITVVNSTSICCLVNLFSPHTEHHADVATNIFDGQACPSLFCEDVDGVETTYFLSQTLQSEHESHTSQKKSCTTATDTACSDPATTCKSF